MRVKRSDFDALLEASYTAKPKTRAGVWDGEVPAPVAPGEHEEREASPPDRPSDPSAAEPDGAVQGDP